MTINEEKTYTRDEAARILSVNPMTIWREIQRGRLRAFKVGKDIRITESALKEYIKNQEIKTKE
jgi:putative molybdopterin biosynthesis protein